VAWAFDGVTTIGRRGRAENEHQSWGQLGLAFGRLGAIIATLLSRPEVDDTRKSQMIVPLNASHMIRRVRHRLGLSQEALARSLNATKAAVQHWERGRNHPDLARLVALHRLCPAGREQNQLDTLIRQAEARVTPSPAARPVRVPRTSRNGLPDGTLPSHLPQEDPSLLRRENARLQQKVMKLETIVKKRDVQLRILQDLAGELQRELVSLHATESPPSGTLLRKAWSRFCGAGRKAGPWTSV